MNINEITIGQLQELKRFIATDNTQFHSIAPAHPYAVGKNYFIRTVTHHFTGTLVEVHPNELVLVDAAWIADDGRFMEAIKSGAVNEVEPFPDGERVIIGRGTVVDAITITWPLPRNQK